MSDDSITSTTDLLAQGCCCGSGCMNCPYVPQHVAGGTSTDSAWVEWSAANPDKTYEDFQLKK